MQKHRCLITILAAALAAGCGSKESSSSQRKEEQAVIITVQPARLLPVQRNVEVVGTLFGEEEATLSAKVPGRVVRVSKDIGDRADAGEILAQIEDTDYQLARQQAQMNLLQTLARLGLSAMPGSDFDPATVPTVVQARLQADNAQARLNRSAKLFDQKPPLISEQDYADLKTNSEVARSAYDVALLSAKAVLAEARTRQADLDLQQRKIDDAAIRAPRPEGTGSGKGRYGVTARLVTTGEYVREGTPMFRVIADDPIRYRASVPERFLPEIKLGQKVQVTVESYNTKFAGVMQRINPQVDQASRSFQVEIRVPNADARLRPGAFARGWIATHEDADVTFVPLESVVSFAGVKKVFTIKDGKAVEHQVTTGIRNGNFLEIIEGLSGAQDVVVSGATRLANGISVQIKAAAPASAPRQTAGVPVETK